MYARRGLGDAPVIAQQALTSAATVAAAFGPPGLIAAGILEAGSLIAGLFETSLTGKEKIATTDIVNQVEPYLSQNVRAYLASPTSANQTAALQNFDAAWAGVVQACSGAQYGAPGMACITDRARGGKFDWFQAYRDPISNTTPGGGLAAMGGTSFSLPLLLGAGVLALAVAS